MQPRIYELDNVNFDIRENHSRALRAAQVKAVREANPSHRVSLLDRFEHALGSFLITAGERLAARQASSERPVTHLVGH